MNLTKGKMFGLGFLTIMLILVAFGFTWYLLLSISFLLFGVWTIYFLMYFSSIFSFVTRDAYKNPKNKLNRFPLVTLIIPLYKESKTSIEKTVDSIINQDYPRDKLEVLFVVEPDDYLTDIYVKQFVKKLRNLGISARRIYSDGKLRIKAHALNVALKYAKGEIIGVYDADDEFPSDQVRKFVKMFLEDRYGAIGTRVYRYRNSKIGKLLNLEMFIWYNMYLPVIYKISRAPPLSGEGLFVRREALEAIGGFPEKLTEDAYITIKMVEAGYKVGLLDSQVEELAPKTIKSLIKQRLRWYRGYIECVGGILKSKVSRRTKIILLLAFSSPAIISLGFIHLLIFGGYTLLNIFINGLKIITIDSIKRNLVFATWSILIAIFTSVFYGLIYSKLKRESRWRPFVKLLLIIPFYWLFLAAIAMYIPFVDPKIWYKTERR